jgi:hypothetical protein
LVKWLLVLPHLIAIAALSLGVSVAGFLAFFATLVTGRFPRPLWDFMAGFHRWAHRVLAYSMLISDQYPPFSLAEAPGDTVRLRADYPETVARWRPLVVWLLIVPFAVAAATLVAVAQVCVVLSAVSILFTRRIPVPIFEVILNSLTWQNQASFYALWMCEQYPLWVWHRVKTL